MSDQDSGPLPELTPEQESEVRRLLAEARHDEPIPAAVADRLDAALADLTRDQPATPGVAPVIDLAARRRRRNAAALLAGAAAVIVAGFGIGQVIDVGSGSDDTAGGSAADADRSAAGSDEDNGDFSSKTDGESPASSPAPAPLDGGVPPLTLRSSHLLEDVTDQLPRLQADAIQAPNQSAESYGAMACAPPSTNRSKFGLGELFPALFDGQPAVLALRPPAGNTQRADVLSCDDARQLDSVTLPLP